MASALSHAAVALTLGQAGCGELRTWRARSLGVISSIVPDLDVVGFAWGVEYGALWGHRGLTHSLLFAAVWGAALALFGYRGKPASAVAGMACYLFLCTASHGVLDAMTDGGLGVAFLSPFDTTRYFFSLRPVLVSPIGVGEFFTPYGLQVLASEARWIWLPSLAVVLLLRLLRGRPPLTDRPR